MSYQPKTWENKPSTASSINATNLNHMEGGIKTNDDNIIDAQNAILTLQGEMLQAQGDISALETLVDSIFPVDTESGNPAVITDAFGGACKSLKLTLEPIQSGSGDPSPTNVRAISGRNSVALTVNSDTETISLGQTVYGGVFDVTSGELTIDTAILDMGSLDWFYEAEYTRFGSAHIDGMSKSYATRTMPLWCSMFLAISDGRSLASVPNDSVYCAQNDDYVLVKTTDYTDATDFKTAVTGQKLVYKLATPTTVQLTPTQIALLHGDNVLTTDADSIEASYSADIALYIAKKIAEGSQNNRSLSKGGSGDEESNEEEKKEEIEIKEAEPLTKEVR